MQGAYGGLIIIIAYAAGVEQELYLITQDGDPILTSDNQRILVQEEED